MGKKSSSTSSKKLIHLGLICLAVSGILYTRLMGIIFSPDRELLMSVGQTTSSCDRFRIKLLLARGAKPDYKGEQSIDALDFAILSEDLWLVEELFSRVSKRRKLAAIKLAEKELINEAFVERIILLANK